MKSRVVLLRARISLMSEYDGVAEGYTDKENVMSWKLKGEPFKLSICVLTSNSMGDFSPGSRAIDARNL